MLESRQEYFSFGDNNPTLANMTIKTVKYKDYKRKYAQNKTVPNSYNASEKTIDVYFESNQIKSCLGETYTQKSFNFVLVDNEANQRYAGMFHAKNEDNATKNAKKFCKLYNHTYICVIKSNETIQQHNCSNVMRCTL